MSTAQCQLSTAHNTVIVSAHTHSEGESVFFKEMVFLALLIRVCLLIGTHIPIVWP